MLEQCWLGIFGQWLWLLVWGSLMFEQLWLLMFGWWL